MGKNMLKYLGLAVVVVCEQGDKKRLHIKTPCLFSYPECL